MIKMTTFYGRRGKRLLDLTCSLLMMPAVAAVCVVVVPIIFLDDRGPALHKSERRGLDGRHFIMYKFRSMTVDAPDLRNEDMSTVNSESDPRVTRVGRLLRKTSIDELPQIVNVLKGDMSFVGPRPNMTTQRWGELSVQEKKRIAVRPGLTGLAQSVYRNAATTEQKYELDSYYVDHVSLPLDIRILARTGVSVIRAKGIYSSQFREEGVGK